MRKPILATLALLLGFSSLAAFCQNPSTANCPPAHKVVHRTKPKLAPAPAPTPVVAPAPAPTPVQPQQQSIVINVPPVNLEPLAVALNAFGEAKLNETHTLENLGDVPSSTRADLAQQYAIARIKVETAQATFVESQANLNEEEAAFTKTKRKSYVALRVLDDLSGVAGDYLGATKISSTITTSAAGGGNGNMLSASGGAGGAGGQGGSTGPVDVTANGGAGGNSNATGGSATNSNKDSNSNQNDNSNKNSNSNSNSNSNKNSNWNSNQNDNSNSNQNSNQNQNPTTTSGGGSGSGGGAKPCPPDKKGGK